MVLPQTIAYFNGPAQVTSDIVLISFWKLLPSGFGAAILEESSQQPAAAVQSDSAKP